MGPRMEQGVPVGVRDGAVRGPAVLLRALRERHVHVPLRRRVVRRHRNGAPVHDGRTALVEHVAAAQDGEAVVRAGCWRRYGVGRRWPQGH